MYEHEKVSSPSIKSFEEGISSGISDPLGDGEFNSFNTPMWKTGCTFMFKGNTSL